jgi:hypothetical protein
VSGQRESATPQRLEIVSRFSDQEVLRSLRAIAEDESGSLLPESVKKLGGKGVRMRIKGNRFAFGCVGPWRSPYNPRCAGSVVPSERGSRIVARAGFSPVGLAMRVMALGICAFAIPPDAHWIYAAVLFVCGWLIIDARRHTGPWRAAMFDIVKTVAEKHVMPVSRERSTISESSRRVPKSEAAN